MSEKLTSEQAMDKLEEIVEKLEAGEVTLEEAVQIYKKGMSLSQFCHQKLKTVEEQLTKTITDNGEEEFIIQEEE